MCARRCASICSLVVVIVLVVVGVVEGKEREGNINENRKLVDGFLTTWEVPSCLSDEFILSNTVIKPDELKRIRENTKDILAGSFLETQTGNLGLGFYGSARGKDDGSDKQLGWPGKLIVEVNDWESHYLASMTTALLLQDVLRYPIEMWELYLANTQSSWERLASGMTHINMENWGSSDGTDGFNTYVLLRQEASDLGINGYTGRNGIYMPSYMNKWDKNKSNILTAWESLLIPDVYQQFPKFKPKNYEAIPSKKERTTVVSAFSCVSTYCPGGYFVPPQCEKDPTKCHEFIHADPQYAPGVVEQMVTNLKLPFVVVFLGDDAIERGFITERMKKKEAVLFFQWVPTVFVSEESLTRVNFPLYTPKCLHNHTTDEFGPINCDFPTELLQIIAWRQLETYAPSAVELVSRLSITEDIMDDFIKSYIKLLPKFTTEKYQELTHTVVCEWFKEHPEVWPLWIPIPAESILLEFSTWEVALIITVAALVIVLAFIFLFFIFWFRKRTIVRYSEPVFLSTMMVGSILVAVGMILNVVPNPLETYSCQLVIWLTSIGFTLFFGTLFTKTLRLVWVFFQIEGQSLNNQFFFKRIHLVVILLVLLSIDFLILGIWTIVDTLHVKDVPDNDSEINYWELCRSKHDSIFIGVLAAYKCVMIASAGIMAYLARRLPNILNESYFISLCVWNVGFFTAIILPLSIVLEDDPEAFLVVRCVGILLGCASTMILVVCPKAYVILKGKHGASEDDTIMDGIKKTSQKPASHTSPKTTLAGSGSTSSS